MNTNTISKFTNFYAEVFPETTLEEYTAKLRQFFSTKLEEAPQAIAQVLSTNASGTFKSVFVGSKKISVDTTGFATMTYEQITKSIVEAMKTAAIKTISVPEILDTYKKLTNKTMFNTSPLIYMNTNHKFSHYNGKTKVYSLV